MRLRRIDSPALGPIMGIPIDTKLLCVGVVHYWNFSISQFQPNYFAAQRVYSIDLHDILM